MTVSYILSLKLDRNALGDFKNMYNKAISTIWTLGKNNLKFAIQWGTSMVSRVVWGVAGSQ